jgi:multiple sugar transport system substrate-binding protein
MRVDIMKTNLTRRTLVRGGAALATSGSLTGPALLEWAKAWAQQASWKPENGAQLSMLRWKAFVQAEDDAFVKMLDAFTKATGVGVTVTREQSEEVQPKAAVAANTGAGPDLIWALNTLPHLFPQKCLNVTDVADYLGKKYGGWVPSAVAYGKGTGSRWIDIPVCYNGFLINYRVSSLKEAGFSTFPTTTSDFLEYAKATKRNNKPGGLALGHAAGDATGWVHWCLWAHGGNVVDKNDTVILNSPETEMALQYARQLYSTMIPGVASWTDVSNNKAFLTNQIYWTANTISIYVAASNDPSLKAMAEDIDHAYWPVGPVGKPTELAGVYPLLAMNYTRYPQACKALMAYMMEADQFNPWMEAAQGYASHCLNAYDSNPVWTKDPKRAVYRDVSKRSLSLGGLGSMGDKLAAAIAGFVLVDMFASYCTGREDLKGAIKFAERQFQRIYR